jgi:hypothetical protein
MHQLTKKGFLAVYVDLFSVTSKEDFIQKFLADSEPAMTETETLCPLSYQLVPEGLAAPPSRIHCRC